MKYYLKDKNGIVHTESQNSFKTALQIVNNGCNYETKDTGDDFPSNCYISNSTKVPFICIKDGTMPMYTEWGRVKSLNNQEVGPDDFNPNEHEPTFHRPIFNCTYRSRKNYYYVSAGSNYNPPYLVMDINNIMPFHKEIYVGNKPIVSYYDKEKGNMLSYNLKDNGKAYNCYWYSKLGPYPEDVIGRTDDNKNLAKECVLMNHSSWNNTSTGFGCQTFSSNLRMKDNSLCYVQGIPEATNDKFGYQFFYPEGATRPQSRLSNFRLNVADIKEKGNKLKLQYFWSFMYKNQESNIESNFASEYAANCDKDKPFVFNYYTTNDEVWSGLSSTDYDEFDTRKNLKSSLVDGVNTCNGTAYKATFNNIISDGEDTWGDSETYKRFLVTYVNDGSDSNEKGYWYLTNNYCQPGCGFIVDPHSLKTNTIATEDNTVYSAREKLIANKRYIVSSDIDDVTHFYIIKPKHDIGDESTSWSTPTTFGTSDFDKIPESQYELSALATSNDKKFNYTLTYSTANFLSALNESDWGQHSAYYKPYIRTDNTACIFDNNNGNGTFTAHVAQGTSLNNWNLYTWYTSGIQLSQFSMTDVLNPNNIINIDNTCLYKNNYAYLNGGSWHYSYSYENHTLFYLTNYLTSETKFYEATANYNGDGPVDMTFDAYTASYCREVSTIEEMRNVLKSYSTSIVYDVTKSYNKDDVVCEPNGLVPYTACCNLTPGGTLRDMVWKSDLFDISKSTDSTYTTALFTKSYNYYGSASYTIDLTNVTDKYIYIANPTTNLLNLSINAFNNRRVVITDLKMTYEATN